MPFGWRRSWNPQWEQCSVLAHDGPALLDVVTNPQELAMMSGGSFGLLAGECRTGAGGTVASDQPDSNIEGEI